jgi:arylsulfatase A-like enzyme
MRVPGLMWWPEKIPAGRVQHEMGLTMDLLPTIAAITGTSLPETQLDGEDISPLMFGTGEVQREAFMYYRGSTLYACRLGPWKAHFLTRPGYNTPKPDAHDPPLLFELRVDPGEKWNVAAQHPEVIEQIRRAVAKHQGGVIPVPTQLEELIRPN